MSGGEPLEHTDMDLTKHDSVAPEDPRTAHDHQSLEAQTGIVLRRYRKVASHSMRARLAFQQYSGTGGTPAHRTMLERFRIAQCMCDAEREILGKAVSKLTNITVAILIGDVNVGQRPDVLVAIRTM